MGRKRRERERQAEQSPLSLSLPQRMDGHLYLVLRATVVIFKLAVVPFRRADERASAGIAHSELRRN